MGSWNSLHDKMVHERRHETALLAVDERPGHVLLEKPLERPLDDAVSYLEMPGDPPLGDQDIAPDVRIDHLGTQSVADGQRLGRPATAVDLKELTDCRPGTEAQPPAVGRGVAESLFEQSPTSQTGQ